MSYTRRYHEVVTKTVSVSYPASENGGSTSVTVSVPVDVNIHVDTLPFDSSINSCNNTVNTLTASVVATEAAEVESRWRNSKKIAGTVISGFFKYTGFEISQQVMELSVKIDSGLNHLRELSKSLVSKKTQMDVDFNRISSRYLKIFSDLDNELSNRVVEMEKPIFQFTRKISDVNEKYLSGSFVNTVSIFNKEQSELLTKISGSRAKNLTHSTMMSAKSFLFQKYKLSRDLSKNAHSSTNIGNYYLPVCFMDYDTDSQKGIEIMHDPLSLAYNCIPFKSENFKNQFSLSNLNWISVSKVNKLKITDFFNQEFAEMNDKDPIRAERIRLAAQKLFDKNQFLSLA